MKLLRRLKCLLFGHVPVIVYELFDKRFGRVDLWLCECCRIYYKEEGDNNGP